MYSSLCYPYEPSGRSPDNVPLQSAKAEQWSDNKSYHVTAIIVRLQENLFQLTYFRRIWSDIHENKVFTSWRKKRKIKKTFQIYEKTTDMQTPSGFAQMWMGAGGFSKTIFIRWFKSRLTLCAAWLWVSKFRNMSVCVTLDYMFVIT